MDLNLRHIQYVNTTSLVNKYKYKYKYYKSCQQSKKSHLRPSSDQKLSHSQVVYGTRIQVDDVVDDVSVSVDVSVDVEDVDDDDVDDDDDSDYDGDSDDDSDDDGDDAAVDVDNLCKRPRAEGSTCQRRRRRRERCG